MKTLLSTILFFLISSVHAQTTTRWINYADSAKSYAKANNMNEEVYILIDYSVHSGKKRMFYWSLEGDSLIKSGMVSHGCCNHYWGDDETKNNPRFSNEPGSHCSSLGKYKIGNRGYSNWGIHVNYKMHGLEKSNSRALSRVIVLHSWEDVSDSETYPSGTPEGWGCPAVSNNFMTFLDKQLKDSKKPVLMWIIN